VGLHPPLPVVVDRTQIEYRFEDAEQRSISWSVAFITVDALEMALWHRCDQELNASSITPTVVATRPGSIRYTERLAEAGAVRSVGNAVAETTIGLYKTELINRRGPWRGAEQVELATGEWVSWWNRRRLHSAAGNLPPAEYEALYYQRLAEAPDAA
jgi:putative transposase